mgnify:CR=1 FL=1
MHSWEDDKKREWSEIKEKIERKYGTKQEWTNNHDIISVLKIIADYEQVCHVLLPYGGGLDFTNIETAYEAENLFINTQDLYKQVKPSILYFETFENAPDWNYFIMECQAQNPIGNNNNIQREVVYTNEKGTFDIENNEFYDKNTLRVERYCQSCKFLFVLKCSPYNKMKGTYRGEHNSLSRAAFREIITKLCQ